MSDYTLIFILGIFFIAWVIYLHYKNKTIIKPIQQPSSIRNDNEIYETTKLGDIREHHNKRLVKWNDRNNKVEQRIVKLKSLKYEELTPEDVLANGTNEEKLNLSLILGLNESDSIDAHILKLKSQGTNSISSLFSEELKSYNDVVSDVAIKLGSEKSISNRSVFENEHSIIGLMINKILDNSSAKNKSIITAQLSKDHSKKGIIGATGALAVANLSGFGLYTAASTSLAAITGAAGIVLPFSIYTGMSSVLAAAVGPLGWSVLAVWAAFKLGGINYKITIPGVVAIATIRARLIEEREIELNSLINIRDNELPIEKQKLNQLSIFIKSMELFDNNHLIRTNSIPR